MVKSENVIASKTYDFALKIVNLYRKVVLEKKEFVLSKQLLRSGTSIGSNVEEAIGGQSRKDFIAKLNIAYKESRETRYWLRLLRDSMILKREDAQRLITDCEEIIKILTSILKTSKSTL